MKSKTIALVSLRKRRLRKLSMDLTARVSTFDFEGRLPVALYRLAFHYPDGYAKVQEFARRLAERLNEDTLRLFNAQVLNEKAFSLRLAPDQEKALAPDVDKPV